MTILQYIFSVYASILGTVLGTPQVEPDPALIAQLEQERPAAVGKNGADALYAIPQAPTGELRKQHPELHPLPDTQKRRRDANRYPAAARQPTTARSDP